MKIMVDGFKYNYHKSGMTTRLPLPIIAAFFFSAGYSKAAPPSGLQGSFVTLGSDRLELVGASDGNQDGTPFTYSYMVTGALASNLIVDYPSTGRQRNVTLNFLSDGTPAGFQEFDFTPTVPPMPPLLRSGDFTIGALSTTLPPVESSAPEALTGSFIKAAGRRFEFLTSQRGRVFVPGDSEYFDYTYKILDSVSSLATLTFDEGSLLAELTLVFDENGEPISFQLVESEDGFAGPESSGLFESGINHHLTDLQIGTDLDSLQGDDLYGAIGRHQTAASKVSGSPATYLFAIENDGDTDDFLLRATPGRGPIRLAYATYPGGENVTAAMISGRYETGELAHAENRVFSLEVSPSRSRGAIVTSVSARSRSVEEAKDAVHSFTLFKSKSKPQPKPQHGKSSKKRR